MSPQNRCERAAVVMCVCHPCAPVVGWEVETADASQVPQPDILLYTGVNNKKRLPHTRISSHDCSLGLERWLQSWRVVPITCCAYRQPRFNSQHPHGGSPPFITLVLRDLMSSSDLHRHQASTSYTHIHTGKTLIHIQ